jgi:hypothetical protein
MDDNDLEYKKAKLNSIFWLVFWLLAFGGCTATSIWGK